MAVHKMLLLATALTILNTASAWAADDPFVGTWKLNMDKSRFSGFEREIKDLGGNKYEWFGASVFMDTKEHPFKFGGTYIAKQESPDKWVTTLKRDGKVTSVVTWTLSDDGQQLKTEVQGTRADGTSYTQETVYTREGRGSGIAGNWKVQNMQASANSDWVIKPYGSDGLSFAWPTDKDHEDLNFDGKDYPHEGPRETPGETSCAKRIDNHTIQLTDKVNGKVTATREAKVSQDGRTLTEPVYRTGQQNSYILVYEKQM
jgi:hypothetical protein